MAESPPSASLRIGIVGAGCAGLTAAEELKKKGYTHVTVLEAKKRAGGKVISIPFSDESGKPRGLYEGGTVFVMPGALYQQYARRYKMTLSHRIIPRARTIDLETLKVTSPFLINSPLPWRSRIRQLLRFMAIMQRNKAANEPGFFGPVWEKFGDSCSYFFTEHGLEFAREAFIPLANALQFPSIEGPIPVAYLIKTVALLFRFGLLQRLKLSFPKYVEGNQVLWQRVAEQHRVLFRTPVKKVRREKTILVTVPQGELEFDRLIWAAPMDDLASIVDVTPEEQDVTSRIRYLKRAVVTCRIDGLPKNVCYFIKNTVDHTVPINYPYAIYEVEPGSSVYNLYPYMHEDTNVDDLINNVYDLAQRLGATRAKLVGAPLIWKWFPYFAVDDFKEGVYGRFEALQGHKNTYFAGEILSGVSVSFGMEYAAKLVERFFPVPVYKGEEPRPRFSETPKVSPPSAFDFTLSGDANRPIFVPVQFKKPVDPQSK